jgi:protein TonB
MMMALRSSPSEAALIHAPDGANASRPPSKAMVVAIGVSVAFHLGLFTYLYLERMGYEAQIAPEPPVISASLINLTPPHPHPATRRQQQTDVHTAPVTAVQPPTTLHAAVQHQTVVATNGTLGDLTGFTPPTTTRLITDPEWLSQPTAAEMSRFYPARDVDAGVTGQVSLLCGVVASGKLADCRIVSETPPGAAFGDAALKLSAFFRMKPRTIDGEPVDGGQTRISIAFRLNDAGQG